MEKLQEAFQVILPYLKANQDNEDAVITFGWIMYDYLKISEGNMDRYSNNLRILNDHAAISFESCFFNESTTDDSKKMLVNSILWSIRRVIMKGELFANKVFPELLRFCGHEAKFIENRGLYVNSKSSASRF